MRQGTNEVLVSMLILLSKHDLMCFGFVSPAKTADLFDVVSKRLAAQNVVLDIIMTFVLSHLS